MKRFRVIDPKLDAYTDWFPTSGGALAAATYKYRPHLLPKKVARTTWLEMKELGYRVQEDKAPDHEH